MPFPDANRDKDEPQNPAAGDSPRSHDMGIDAKAEVNHHSSVEGRPATPTPSAEKSLDRAAADAAFSARMGAGNSHGDAPPPNQV